MPDRTEGRSAGREAGAQALWEREAAGIAAGTEVLTLDGALPVEFLGPGDRIVTRAGARVLRRLRVAQAPGPAIRIDTGSFGKGRPEGAVILGPATGILLRDWRALALYGKAQAIVPAARLVDGHHVTLLARAPAPLFALEFDAAEVIYAGGLELAARPLRQPQRA